MDLPVCSLDLLLVFRKLGEELYHAAPYISTLLLLFIKLLHLVAYLNELGIIHYLPHFLYEEISSITKLWLVMHVETQEFQAKYKVLG